MSHPEVRKTGLFIKAAEIFFENWGTGEHWVQLMHMIPALLVLTMHLVALRWPWIGLLIVGLLGTAYTAGMVLYNGPLIATPGYLLVLIGALLAVLSGQPAGNG